MLWVRLSDELYGLIETDARVKGLNKSELVRTILMAYYDSKTVFSAQLKQSLGLRG